MMEEEWEAIDDVAGMLQAEMLRGLLEAEGFSVELSQEGAGHALGLTVGPLGSVLLLVKAEQAESARQALDRIYAELATPAEPDSQEPEAEPPGEDEAQEG